MNISAEINKNNYKFEKKEEQQEESLSNLQ